VSQSRDPQGRTSAREKLVHRFRKGETRVRVTWLVTSQSSHRDHHLETNFGTLSFKLSSNPSLILILGLCSRFSKRRRLAGEKPSGANDATPPLVEPRDTSSPAAGIGGRYGLNGIQRRHSLGLGLSLYGIRRGSRSRCCYRHRFRHVTIPTPSARD
jgi:hypothetical protein